MRRMTIGVLAAALCHRPWEVCAACPGRPAPVVEPLGRRGLQEGRALRGQAALRGEAPRPHRRDHLLREEEHVAGAPGGLHGRLRLPRRLLLRQRRPRVHGRRLARRPLAGHPLGEHRALRQGVLDAAGARRQGRHLGRSRSRRRPTSSTSTRSSSASSASRSRPTSPSRRTSSRTSSRSARRPATRPSPPAPPTASGRRMYVPDMLLLSKLGYADVQKLYRGELSWKDPRVVEVFRYYKELDRPRRLREDAHQHAARRGAPVLPHRAEGVHVPGRAPGTRGGPSCRRRRAASRRTSSSGSSTTPS